MAVVVELGSMVLLKGLVEVSTPATEDGAVVVGLGSMVPVVSTLDTDRMNGGSILGSILGRSPPPAEPLLVDSDEPGAVCMREDVDTVGRTQ